MPPAPLTFSKIIGWPKSSDSRDAKMRPKISPAPPAANGNTMVTCRVGQFCAVAGSAVAARTARAAIILRLGIDPSDRCDGA